MKIEKEIYIFFFPLQTLVPKRQRRRSSESNRYRAAHRRPRPCGDSKGNPAHHAHAGGHPLLMTLIKDEIFILGVLKLGERMRIR